MVIAICHIQDRASYPAKAKWTAAVGWLQGTNTMSSQCVQNGIYCFPPTLKEARGSQALCSHPCSSPLWP